MHNDRLTFTYRQLWLRILMFIVMFLPGAVLLIMTPAMTADVEKPGAGLAVGALALFMVAFGLAMTFGRYAKIIDRRRREFIDRMGIFGWTRTRVYPFDQLDTVILSHSVARSRSGRFDRYKIHFGIAAGELYIWEYGNYEQARVQGEEVAQLVGLPLVDVTESDAVVRQVGDLNASIIEQLRNDAQQLECPQLPHACQLKAQTDGDELVVEIPSSGFGFGNIVALAIAAGFLFSAGRFLVSLFTAEEPALVFWLLSAVVLGFFGMLFLFLGAIAPFMHERMIVSQRAIQIQRIGPLGTRVDTFDPQQVEEFNLRANAGDLQLRGDQFSREFASDAAPEEREWLYAMIRYTIIHGPPS